MCGNGLIGIAQAQLRTTAAVSLGTLRAPPSIETMATAEIQDRYEGEHRDADAERKTA
jgi:hypothetical protein